MKEKTGAPVYADNAATTKMCKAASDAMLLFSRTEYGNPSSQHQAGRAAATALEEARATIAACLGASPQEVFFTSGGTEADNWALFSAALRGSDTGKRHIISTRFEHHAVLNPLRQLGQMGFEVTLLDVHEDGIVRPDEVTAAMREDTALVSIMYANNEIGTVQPIAEIGALCQERDVVFHTDAVQAVGHVPIDMRAQGVDMLSLSAHKFHGPKGVGALCCREDAGLLALLLGGGQERGKRAGTENVAAICAMAAALRIACERMEATSRKVSRMRDSLISAIGAVPGAHLTGHAELRLPGIVHFCFEGVHGEALLMLLDDAGICASTSSACASATGEPSHVLRALGVPDKLVHGALRLSLCGSNTKAEVGYIIKTLPALVAQLRATGAEI